MSRATVRIAYRRYGWRDFVLDLASQFSVTTDSGWVIVVQSGNRSWQVRTVFTDRSSAAAVADDIQVELARDSLDIVLQNHRTRRLSKGALDRLSDKPG